MAILYFWTRQPNFFHNVIFNQWGQLWAGSRPYCSFHVDVPISVDIDDFPPFLYTTCAIYLHSSASIFDKLRQEVVVTVNAICEGLGSINDFFEKSIVNSSFNDMASFSILASGPHLDATFTSENVFRSFSIDADIFVETIYQKSYTGIKTIGKVKTHCFEKFSFLTTSWKVRIWRSQLGTNSKTSFLMAL